MSKHVRIPDDLHERLQEEADERGTSIGEVVRDYYEGKELSDDEVERIADEVEERLRTSEVDA
jgi:predicted CopG family antitoxin